MIALPTWLPGGCPTSRGTAFDIKLINEISGNDPEISEAISRGHIELFGKEFEELKENPDGLLHWMKSQVSAGKKLETERRKSYPPNIQKLIEEADATLDELGITDKTIRKNILKRWQMSEN